MKQQSKRYRPLMLWHLDETHSANRKSEKNVGCTGREQGAKNQRRQPCSKGKYAGTIGEKRKKSYIPFYKYIKQHDSFRNKRKFNRRRKDHADDEGIHRSIRSKILCKNSSKEKKISMVILLQAVQEGRALHTELPTAALQKKKRLLVTTLVFSTKKQKALVSSDEVYTMTVFKCNFRRKFPTNNAMPRRRKDHADDEGIHRSIRSKILCKNSSKEKKISMVILLQAVQEGRALHTELPTDLDLNVTLICMKARKVPFALREKTDAELDKLVEQGVLEPMNHPTQRKSLAKLDLAQAYQQLTVDDATADAQTIITHRGAFRVKRFKIDATGIHPAKAKVQAIQDAPTPKNKQQLQAFLGLLNFYHSFLKDKATVAEQLHRLLDKNARWIWTSKHEKAFRDVKRLLSSDAVLTHYDGEKPMRCIATWFGAVLCHKLSSTQEIPITFYSRTLSTMERNYGQIDKEALAVIAGVKKFHEYLYGRQFTIITDHKPLFGLFVPKKETPQILSPRMLRWSILLNAYDYTINYRPGKEIANADALSRLPKQSTENNDSHNPVILSLETIDNSPLHSKDITRITAKDPILTRVLSWAWRSWPKSVSDERLKPYVTRQHELSIHNGCLLWGSRVIIPLQARHKIFKELHIGHPGIVRMKALSRSYVWWPKLDSEIENLVYARNYSSEKTWKPATFVTQTGPPSYQVQTEDGQLWPRHIDQRKSNHRKIKLEKKTVEAIPEEDTAVVTTPREESAAASPSPDIESVGQQRSSTQMKIYVPVIDKICLLQQIGIREEILDSIELFLFKSSFKSCIANTYSDFSPYNYSLFAYNEKTSSCSKLHAMPEENIIVNCSEQLHDLQFYKKIGIRQEILNSIGLFMSAASFKYCIAYSYSDFSPYNYSLFAYDEKARLCSPLYDLPEENIIDNRSEQLYDLQFYKVTHCLPAEGFMYSFEEEVEENVNKINAVKLKATAEICIVERHPFNENFFLKRTGMLFLQSLELCLAHCRVVSGRSKCNAVLFSGEEKVCLLLRQNQPLQSRDVMRKSASQLFTLNYCYYNMTESSQRRDYNGRGNKINLRIGSMRVQCTVHEIPLLRKHMKQQCLLWKSKTLRHCIKFCARQYRANLCNAVYFEAEEKTCLHLLLNASQALHEYTESKKETIHFIEKCVEVAERQENQQESAINRIQSDETSIYSPSRQRCCRTNNIRAEGFMYSFEEEVEENVNKINAVKLKATAEICIVERHPFSENFLLKRTKMFFLQSLELCLAHCRVLSVRGKCNAVLFSGEERVCLLLQQNQPLQSRDVMRKSASQFFTVNYCDYNMTESSQRRDYNGRGKKINLHVESMRVQCTVHEIPLLRKHMKHQFLLWNSINFRYCIQFCVQQFQRNLCNAVYFEAEEKTCLHLLLNASQALHEYTESRKETIHFIEKCVEVAERQEYQQESAINRIQSDETSLSSPSRPRSSRTHNVHEQELDFFHYVAAEDVHEQYTKLYEFFEVCKIQVLNIGIIRNAFAIQIRRKIYSLNRCLHICRRHTSCMAILYSKLDHQCKKIFKGRSGNLILVQDDELVLALKECFKVLRNADTLFILYNRPAERKCNADPVVYYFKETHEICAVEIYKQKNLTSWEVITISKDVSNFRRYCTVNQELWLICITKEEKTDRQRMEVPRNQPLMYERAASRGVSARQGIKFQSTYLGAPLWREPSYILER
ncbi:Transposon Tf2-8 polyprotein [Trichinella spiralis]|uniref:RNA-directed DNA polymerase n=1 Tax=Trichinella spiralis TaxID=6334 RepID=A0A0V1BER7_TRISP|nr:Transposon Tf2-8 polyprotein [Trichinella spiralis]